MPGTDKREAAYARARKTLLTRLLEKEAFDMDEHDRGEIVKREVEELEAQHPELDEQMVRRLRAEGMRRTFGDANIAAAEDLG